MEGGNHQDSSSPLGGRSTRPSRKLTPRSVSAKLMPGEQNRNTTIRIGIVPASTGHAVVLRFHVYLRHSVPACSRASQCRLRALSRTSAIIRVVVVLNSSGARRSRRTAEMELGRQAAASSVSGRYRASGLNAQSIGSGGGFPPRCVEWKRPRRVQCCFVRRARPVECRSGPARSCAKADQPLLCVRETHLQRGSRPISAPMHFIGGWVRF